jgi:protein TonB
MSRTNRRRLVWTIVLTCFVGTLGVGAFTLVRAFVSGTPPQPKKLVQEIKVIRPPPPPPDLPPPPPPPPEEKVNIPDPEQKPDPTPSNEPPPGDQLGVDAAGEGAGDNFNLVGRPGGRDLIGGPGGSVATWYAGLVQGEILEQLSDDEQLRKGSYKVRFQIWIKGDGSVERVRVINSSGDSKRDREIEDRAQRVRLSRPPPAEVPQPLTIGVQGHG